MVQKFDLAISDALASLLPIATFASTERAVNEIYKHVLMRSDGNKCFAIASNGAQTIIRSIPMPLLGSEPFAVCIDGVKLRAILSSLKDASESEISISWTDALANIKIGRSKLTASVVDASIYPETEKLGEEHSSLIIPGSILHQSLRSVSHSCAIRDARHYLNGCHFAFTASGFSVTGSDGHRLSRVCKNLTLSPSANAAEGIFPVKFIDLLGVNLDKNGDVRLRMSANMVEVTWSAGQIRSTLIDGKYPDIKPFFDSAEKPLFTCSKAQVLNSIGRLKATVFEKLPSLGIHAENGEIKLSTLNDKQEETGLDFMQADIMDDSARVSINISYLSDALSQIEDDEVRFSLVTANSLKVCSTSNPDFSAIIAQLRR